MNLKNIARKSAPAAGIFSLAFVGVLALAPNDTSTRDDLVPVLVATRTLSDGTESSVVRTSTEVRLVPASARSDGAIIGFDALPEGVLAFDHVRGQQILTTSFARNRVSSLGSDFVAVSVALDAQRWVGPWLQAGRLVDVYDTGEPQPALAASRAVILDVPDSLDAADPEPAQDAVISLGIPKESLVDVLTAAENGTVWLVGR